jgi:hypothetical protein
MTKLLEQAMAKVATLPAKTQEKIGAELLAHVDKVSALRDALERGVTSLDRGKGKELDIAKVIGRALRKDERRN